MSNGSENIDSFGDAMPEQAKLLPSAVSDHFTHGQDSSGVETRPAQNQATEHRGK